MKIILFKKYLKRYLTISLLLWALLLEHITHTQAQIQIKSNVAISYFCSEEKRVSAYFL